MTLEQMRQKLLDDGYTFEEIEDRLNEEADYARRAWEEREYEKEMKCDT